MCIRDRLVVGLDDGVPPVLSLVDPVDSLLLVFETIDDPPPPPQAANMKANGDIIAAFLCFKLSTKPIIINFLNVKPNKDNI